MNPAYTFLNTILLFNVWNFSLWQKVLDGGHCLFFFLLTEPFWARVSKQGCCCKDVGTAHGNPGKEILQASGRIWTSGSSGIRYAVCSSKHLAPCVRPLSLPVAAGSTHVPPASQILVTQSNTHLNPPGKGLCTNYWGQGPEDGPGSFGEANLIAWNLKSRECGGWHERDTAVRENRGEARQQGGEICSDKDLNHHHCCLRGWRKKATSQRSWVTLRSWDLPLLLIGSKYTGMSVLHSQGPKFCQQPEWAWTWMVPRASRKEYRP